MGFTRRFSNFPPASQITEIEGIVIVDQTSPGAINGVGTGVACVVGEFADVTYGVNVDSNGVVTTKANPVEIFSGQDLTNKVGGFDPTIGEFGGSGGNGWLELKNKSFSRLVVVPINIASSQGARLWRHLPTNKSATNPQPVVAIAGGVVPAGTEFKSGTNRVHTAKSVQFSNTNDFLRNTDGAATSAGAAEHQAFTSATGTFTTVKRPDGTIGVQVGDAVVIGVIGGAGALGGNAFTFRVRGVTSDTVLDLELHDGSNFDWVTGASLPFRIHTWDVADTGGQVNFAAQSGYNIPARPLDATIAVSVKLSPTIVPIAETADNADPLSGLHMATSSVTGLVYTANVQAPNAAANATLDALYYTAIDSLLNDDLPEREVDIVWPARYSATIDQKITSHVLAQKANGIGRIGIVSPPLSVTDPSVVLGDASPGVGFSRARESLMTWPGFSTFVTAAVGVNVKGADGLLHADGMLDTPASGWLASCLSQLAPERNVGQASDPIQTIMANTIGIQRGVSGLDLNYYSLAKARGLCSGRNDRSAGRIFQSDVTRSLNPGETLIRVRRFSFFIQDTLAQALMPLSKEPLSEELKDTIITTHIDFFEQLLSRKNPAGQRILAYTVDPNSGNTPELNEAGIYVVIHSVEMLPTADDIVLQSQVGYGVVQVSQLNA